MAMLLRGRTANRKTFVIEQFGKEYFEDVLTINLELEPRYKSCFTSLAPQKIIQEIEVISARTLIPGKNTFFFR